MSLAFFMQVPLEYALQVLGQKLTTDQTLQEKQQSLYSNSYN